ncbi:MAG TPA: hypothetical protein VIG06_27330 [Kofleriaceae bacterium]|jgi:hypothetical protein
MKRPLLVLAAVAAAAVLAFLVWPRGGRDTGDKATGGEGSVPLAATASGKVAPDPRPDHPPPPGAGHSAESPRPRLTPEARARLAGAIEEARSKRTARTAAPAAASPTRLDLRDRIGVTTDWERRQIGALNDLLGECYDLGRAEDPALAGKVMLLFTVSGEPGVGGLVSDAHFDETGTTIAQATARECMIESLGALELEPPPEGISVSRQITLDLAPD